MFAGVLFSVFSLTFIGVSGQYLNSSCIDCDCCIDGHCNRNVDKETCDYGCTDGHWGTHCMYDCEQGCSTCNRYNGLCKPPCIDGFYGSNCNNTCLPNCATCSGGTSCSTCKDGFYRGRYHDLPGTSYFSDCHLECQDNCKSCYSYGSCQQWKAMSGQNLNSSCLDCDCCIGGQCNFSGDNETCDYGCTDGHWGEHCMNDCIQNCTLCYKSNGLCQLCEGGVYGSNCINTCLPNCATCSGGTSCSTCRDGFYRGQYHDLSGSSIFYDCHLECQVNCKRCSSYGNCQEWETDENRNSSCVNCSCCMAGSCIHGDDDHTCDYGCTDGHWGTNCMHDCGQNCARCYQTTGVCSDCIAGLYGPFCNNTCLPRCSTCRYSYECTSCKDGLYIGRYKDQPRGFLYYDCQLACPVNCKRCSSFSSCTECQTGKFGTTCSSQCSEGCTDNVCAQPNGYCDCTEGFEGLRCDNCISGIENDTCVSAQTATTGNINIATYVLLGLTCLVIGLLIAFAVVMFIRYQRKRIERRSTETPKNTEELTDTSTTRKDQPVYVNTNLSQATYYNSSQVVDGNILQDSTMPVDNYYEHLQGDSTEIHYEVPRN